jgi:hypothetical protein
MQNVDGSDIIELPAVLTALSRCQAADGDSS